MNLKYLDYVVSKTLVSHQYLRNISAAGSGVESEIRDLLGRLIPGRFKVTHGYIVGSNGVDVEPDISPQVDVIIVDSQVPHSIWTWDDGGGLELVPREAVVGVIEVKRTIKRETLVDAISHLIKIRDSVGLNKYDQTAYMPGGVAIGGGLQSPYRTNPLFGVIGVAADNSFATNPTETVEQVIDLTASDSRPLELDLVFSIDGALVATGAPDGSTNYHAYNERRESEKYPWREDSGRTGSTRTQALGKGVGFILAYLFGSAGKFADIEGYFFNRTLGGS